MSSTDTLPRLLPGPSAWWWAKAFTFPLYLFLALDLLFVLAQFIPPVRSVVLDEFFGPLAGLAVLVVVAAGLAFLFNSRAQKRETAAGYTTLWRLHPTLPQLDSSTGATIRAAGAPYMKRSEWRKQSANGAQAPVASAVPRPTIARRLLPLIASILAPLVVAVGVLVISNSPRGAEFGLTAWIGGGIFVIIAGSNVVAALVARARLRQLRTVVPADFAFLFSSSRDFRLQAVTLDWHGGVEGPARFRGASANSAGLTFWQGKPPAEVATLPWKLVVSIQADNASRGNSSVPAVLVAYKDEAGDIQSLPLASPNASMLPTRSMSEARWIASELNQLRTGSTTAHLI
jgi:hypothetical protein